MLDYRIFRAAAFALDAEVSHELTIRSFKTAPGLVKATFGCGALPQAPVKVMGLDFPNPVGLAAGLDKNGECTEALGSLGFGFLEVGTVTPKPQPGNPKPRLFRLTQDQALINRLGFNNLGLDVLCSNIEASQFRANGGILGVNIGKNKSTPAEQAADDYVAALKRVYHLASYITVNISSPNTPGLRDMQAGQLLSALLEALQQERQRLEDEQGYRIPMVVKIAPDDAEDDRLLPLLDAAVASGIDGVIATNTTISRPAFLASAKKEEQGGLSGAPLLSLSNEVLARCVRHLDKEIAVIGVGGILKPEDALEKINLGADLVQIYSGFIYEGPQLIKNTVKTLSEHLSTTSPAL